MSLAGQLQHFVKMWELVKTRSKHSKNSKRLKNTTSKKTVAKLYEEKHDKFSERLNYRQGREGIM